MNKSLVANEHYVGLQGWMLNSLNLKGNELIVFAIIHGFSQGEQGVFNGSLQYLADWTNSTKRSVINNLSSLINKKLIKKNEIYKGSLKYCEYVSTFTGGEKSSMDEVKNFHQGGEKSSPNNIVNNIDNNIEKQFEEFWTKYPRHIAKQNARKAYASAIKNKKVTHDQLIAAVDKYIKFIKQENTDERFIKHAASWLNASCWEDEYNIKSPSKPQERHEPTEAELLEFRRKRQQEIEERNSRGY